MGKHKVAVAAGFDLQVLGPVDRSELDNPKSELMQSLDAWGTNQMNAIYRHVTQGRDGVEPLNEEHLALFDVWWKCGLKKMTHEQNKQYWATLPQVVYSAIMEACSLGGG